MEEKMKKMLFLMLFLVTLGTGGTNAQVRIGGNGQPNAAAVLDLNATDAINTGTKGLALPRVSLASNTAQITSGTANLNGMLVYNTGGSLSIGVYYWNGTNWVKVTVNPVGTQDLADGAITNSKIAPGAVDSNSIKNGSISFADLRAPSTTEGEIGLRYLDGAWRAIPQRSFYFYSTRVDSALSMPRGTSKNINLAIPEALPQGYTSRQCMSVLIGNTDFEFHGWPNYRTGYIARRDSFMRTQAGINIQSLCLSWL